MKVINNTDKQISQTVMDVPAGNCFMLLGSEGIFMMTDKYIIVDIATGEVFNYLEEGWADDVIVPLVATVTIERSTHYE